MNIEKVLFTSDGSFQIEFRAQEGVLVARGPFLEGDLMTEGGIRRFPAHSIAEGESALLRELNRSRQGLGRA
jgi:hypothetical protein